MPSLPALKDIKVSCHDEISTAPCIQRYGQCCCVKEMAGRKVFVWWYIFQLYSYTLIDTICILKFSRWFMLLVHFFDATFQKLRRSLERGLLLAAEYFGTLTIGKTLCCKLTARWEYCKEPYNLVSSQTKVGTWVQVHWWTWWSNIELVFRISTAKWRDGCLHTRHVEYLNNSQSHSRFSPRGQLVPQEKCLIKANIA